MPKTDTQTFCLVIAGSVRGHCDGRRSGSLMWPVWLVKHCRSKRIKGIRLDNNTSRASSQRETRVPPVWNTDWRWLQRESLLLSHADTVSAAVISQASNRRPAATRVWSPKEKPARLQRGYVTRLDSLSLQNVCDGGYTSSNLIQQQQGGVGLNESLLLSVTNIFSSMLYFTGYLRFDWNVLHAGL